MKNESKKMRFKCWECGRYFNEYKEVQESRGEFWGIPCSETMCYCPYCNGDFDEAEVVEKAERDERNRKRYEDVMAEYYR
jgi:hypothetical protein